MKSRNLRSFEIYRTLKEVNDQHIPALYRLFERDGKLIVVEEHIDGQTLEEILIYQTTAIDEKFAAEILRQVCQCLAVIHKAGIVHRDIKPSNIMLIKGNIVKLIDFGIARKFKPDSLADTEALGTRGYASPEQFGLFDFGQTDARSDIYSLGITIKQLLGEDYRGWLLKILNRCTALEPARRYQSIPEVLNAIDNGHKFRLLKKIFAGVVVFIAIIIFPAASTDIQPIEDEQPKQLTPTEKVEVVAEPVADKVSGDLNPNVLNQLIDFTKTPQKSQAIFPVEIPSAIESKPLPAPVEQKKIVVKPRESFDDVDLYLYLNGNLTGTNHSHIIEINGWQSWSSFDNGVAFPFGWNARFHVENHSTEDLIEPLITVVVGQDEYSVRKPTIKVGQSLELDIPLAGKFAAPLKGTGHLQIILQAQGKKPIYLNRTFKLIQ